LRTHLLNDKRSYLQLLRAKLKLWKAFAAREKHAKKRGDEDDKEKREHDCKNPAAYAARLCVDAAVHVPLNFPLSVRRLSLEDSTRPLC